MSGSVTVEGNASQSAAAHRPRRAGGHPRRRLLALRHLDEGRRHRRARLGRAHERLHGPEGPPAGVRRRRRRAGRLDLRGAALRPRHASPASAPTASRRSCATSTPPRSRDAARAGGDRRRRSRPSSAATDRRASSTTSRSTTPGTSEMALRESALFSREVIAEIQRAAREGVYDIRGFGAKRRLPHFDDLLLLGASMSRYPLEGYRERCDTNVVLGTRHAKRPLELDIPITIAGHELRRALGAGQGGAGPRRERDGHLDDDRRRRHDARGAGRVEDARLPAAALALRDEPRRPAARGRDRDRDRPGRQARRRRHPARPEDLRSRGGDARPAAGHRPAQRVPSPRLDGARRPRRSRSRSCARSPIGRSRSSSRSARRAPTSTSRSRSRRART